jgi:hypothetical protein
LRLDLFKRVRIPFLRPQIFNKVDTTMHVYLILIWRLSYTTLKVGYIGAYSRSVLILGTKYERKNNIEYMNNINEMQIYVIQEILSLTHYTFMQSSLF